MTGKGHAIRRTSDPKQYAQNLQQITGERDKPITYQPKGSMCAACLKCFDDCSGLPFSQMPVHALTKCGTKIVICTEFRRDA